MIDSYLDILNFRYSPETFERFFGRGSELLTRVPKVFSQFDLVIHNEMDYRCDISEVSKTIGFIQNSQNLVELSEHLNKIEWLDVLIVAGADTHMGNRMHLFEKLKHKVGKIYHESKNVNCDWITGIPMGVNVAYVVQLGRGRMDQILKTPKIPKSKLIGTAFGRIWGVLTKKISERARLKDICDNNNVIERFDCKFNEYLPTLREFKYFACPIGNGIQTPKICEAILCQTIPVVIDNPLHRD
ncbi:MAG: hypothetical protein VW270_04090, partial [Candidatus Poseidoniales archaeon]